MFNIGGEMVDYWMGATPMRRPGESEELAGIAVYLASDVSSFAQVVYLLHYRNRI